MRIDSSICELVQGTRDKQRERKREETHIENISCTFNARSEINCFVAMMMMVVIPGSLYI